MNLKYLVLNNEITTRSPDGFFQLEKDKEAVQEYMRHVEENSMKWNSTAERISFMINNGYYEDFHKRYEPSDVIDIFEMAKGYNFQFQSFMAIRKFYEDYALKTHDNKLFLEEYSDRVASNALHLAQGDVEKAKRYVHALMQQRVQPATPTFFNAGRHHRGELVSCFLMEMDDTINSIAYYLGVCMQLSKIGGGVAVNLSKIRGRGESVNGNDGAAKGIIPVMRLMEDIFSYVDQGGQRKGSGAAYYNIFGWDVQEFLDSKKINVDDKIRMPTLSIGLIVPNKFYELAEKNEPLYVFGPYSVYSEYGIHMDDMNMDEMYEKLLSNPNVKKKKLMNARDMLNKIAIVQLESGYPYIMNKTNANEQHALKDIGTIRMSNLCTEIFQLNEPSVITDEAEPNIVGRDISCNLSSLNVVNVMNTRMIKESVYDGMDILTAVSDMSNVKNAASIARANREMHAVGLGVMNLAGFFALNKIAYDSAEAKDFVRTFFMMINFYSLERSMLIAKERKVTFADFEKSEYAKGTYFDKYLETDFHPTTEKVQRLFEGMYIPSIEDWKLLKDQIQENGLYHAYRLAVAPTQSISYIQNATASVMPVVDHIESRTYDKSTTYYPMPYLAPDNMFYYKSAYNMDQFKVIDLIAEMQQHVDQGISTVLHVNSNVATNELARYYVYAAKKGLKSLYYTRTRKLSVEECLTCAV